MKVKEYQKVLDNYYNLSTIIGVSSVKEMEQYLFDFSTGERLPLNNAQVAQMTRESEKNLLILEEKAMDEAFEQITK